MEDNSTADRYGRKFNLWAMTALLMLVGYPLPDLLLIADFPAHLGLFPVC
jgi:hypothetical protein